MFRRSAQPGPPDRTRERRARSFLRGRPGSAPGRCATRLSSGTVGTRQSWRQSRSGATAIMIRTAAAPSARPAISDSELRPASPMHRRHWSTTAPAATRAVGPRRGAPWHAPARRPGRASARRQWRRPPVSRSSGASTRVTCRRAPCRRAGRRRRALAPVAPLGRSRRAARACRPPRSLGDEPLRLRQRRGAARWRSTPPASMAAWPAAAVAERRRGAAPTRGAAHHDPLPSRGCLSPFVATPQYPSPQPPRRRPADRLRVGIRFRGTVAVTAPTG